MDDEIEMANSRSIHIPAQYQRSQIDPHTLSNGATYCVTHVQIHVKLEDINYIRIEHMFPMPPTFNNNYEAPSPYQCLSPQNRELYGKKLKYPEGQESNCRKPAYQIIK